MISIIDYDAGNIKSVEKALDYLGEEVAVTRDRDMILASDRVILPGVGSFGDAMERIRSYGLDKVIYEFVDTGRPFLGICLGLQVLFNDSEESPGAKGLGLIDGHILRLPKTDESLKIPHMGWNDIRIEKGAKLFEGIAGDPYVYFVHSYYLKADDISDVAAVSYYGTEIHASVQHNNIYACQFHPEKSSEVGLKILKNFVNL